MCVELHTTYYDTLFSEVVANQNRNVALRWAKKRSSEEEESDIRPGAIVSTLMHHDDFDYSVGFGEAKPRNSSTTKHSVYIDNIYSQDVAIFPMQNSKLGYRLSCVYV
ncbi:unnamed protein product [Mucor hiemalis]